MTKAKCVEYLDAALVVSEQMLGAAKEEDWQRLIDLETKRHDLIRSAFAKPIARSDGDNVAAVVGRIQAINQSLIALGNQGREKLAGALNRMATGRRALSAYAGATRG